jgi:hypothetical protein
MTAGNRPAGGALARADAGALMLLRPPRRYLATGATRQNIRGWHEDRRIELLKARAVIDDAQVGKQIL